FELPQPETIHPDRTSLMDDLHWVAPEHIVVPLMGFVFRAPLGPVDFVMFLWGVSGAFKTALAAVFQRFFGQRLGEHNLPGGWNSTSNATEAILSSVRDAVVVVDDYVPEGSDADRSRTESKAASVIRAV